MTITGCDSYLRLIDLTTGKQSQQLPLGDYVVASPAILSDRVFVGTYSGKFLAADLQSAEIIWEYQNPDQQFPIYASAAVTPEVVIMAGKDKHIYAFDPSTGQQQWSFVTKSGIEASPVIEGQRVFVATTAGNLYALDIKTGNQTWFFQVGFPMIASPVVAAERFIVGDTNGSLSCFGKKR